MLTAFLPAQLKKLDTGFGLLLLISSQAICFKLIMEINSAGRKNIPFLGTLQTKISYVA